MDNILEILDIVEHYVVMSKGAKLVSGRVMSGGALWGDVYFIPFSSFEQFN